MAFSSMLKRYDSTLQPEDFSKPITGKNGQSWSVYQKEILRPENDKRDYRIIRLANGMQICLISSESDPSDQAAAAVVVRTGSFHEPPELPGLAHLCEHLLFNGSNKYPQESEYENFISSHNGWANAYTEDEYQTYGFEVSAKNLGGALDRMASILVDPLFDESLVEREVNAVESEYQGYKQNDSWKVCGLLSAISRPGHPETGFTTGSKETLWNIPREKGINVRDALVKFHKERYSANLMRACLVGNESLDDLAEMASSNFAPMSNSNIAPSVWPSNVFGDQQLMHEITYRTIRDTDKITISFPMPDQNSNWKTEPLAFISMLLEHEVEGSLLSYLKKKGWVNNIGANEGQNNTGYSRLDIYLNLTVSGRANYGDVIAATFSFIKLMKKHGAKAFERQFREYQTMGKLGFRWAEPGEAAGIAMDAASSMHDDYPEQFINGLANAQEWDEAKVQKVLDAMSSSAFSIHRGTQDPDKRLDLDLKEKYYETEYRTRPIPAAILSACVDPPYISDLKLPKANPLTPWGPMEPLPKVNESDCWPSVLCDGPIKMWQSRDSQFVVPKVYVWVEIRSNLGLDHTQSARDLLVSRLYTDVLDDMLAEYAYSAAEAGLEYALCPDYRGLSLSLNGYRASIATLMDVVLRTVRDGVDIDQKDFDRLKELVARGIKNWRMSGPRSLAHDRFGWLLAEKYYSNGEKEAAIGSITLEEVLDYGKRFFAEPLHFEVYAHGDQNEKFMQDLKGQLASFQPQLPKDTRPTRRSSPLPGTKALVRGQVQNPANVNSAYIEGLYIGHGKDRRSHVTLSVLVDLLQQRCFDELRTKQQLGYVVQLYRTSAGGVDLFQTEVESEVSPEKLEKALAVFLEAQESYLVDLSDEEFLEHKQSVIDGLLESFKSSMEEGCYYWGQIEDRNYNFKEYKEDAKLTEEITKDEVVAMFRERVLPSGALRAKIAVHMRSQRLQPSAMSGLDRSVLAEDARKKLGLYLADKPTREELISKIQNDSAGEELEKMLKIVDVLCQPAPVPDGVELITSREEFIKDLQLAP